LYGTSGKLSAKDMNQIPISCVMREFFLEKGICNEKQKSEAKFEHVLYYFRFLKEHRGKLGLLEDGGQRRYATYPDHEN
jgi:hypothetical protein